MSKTNKIKVKVLYSKWDGNILIRIDDVDSSCNLVLSEITTILDENREQIKHFKSLGHDGWKDRIEDAIYDGKVSNDVLTLIKYKAVDINNTWHGDFPCNNGYVILEVSDVDVAKNKLMEL